MHLFSIALLLLFVSVLFLNTVSSASTIQLLSNTIGANPGFIANGKSNEEVTCKTDDGRIQIPLNGKIRTSLNSCRVCTCTVTGFMCEDECETATASTSTESTTLSPGAMPLLLLDSTSTPSASTTSTSATDEGSPTSTLGPFDADVPAVVTDAPCSLSAAAREYAFVDCSEVYLAGKRTSGIYEIWPRTSPKPFRVLCDMVTDGGGWTIIQRRGDFNRQSDFFVGWSSYKRGFGNLNRDFWLGNEKIFALTNQDEYRLHIDLVAFSNETRFADYEWFFVTSEQTKYTLNLGRFMPSSTGGDSLSYNRGMRFTTRDQDNDQSMSSQCAENYKSGWWHAGCTLANLNGLYSRGNDSTATGVFWNNWLGAKYSLKGCEMKVRPSGFNTEMLS